MSPTPCFGTLRWPARYLGERNLISSQIIAAYGLYSSWRRCLTSLWHLLRIFSERHAAIDDVDPYNPLPAGFLPTLLTMMIYAKPIETATILFHEVAFFAAWKVLESNTIFLRVSEVTSDTFRLVLFFDYDCVHQFRLALALKPIFLRNSLEL